MKTLNCDLCGGSVVAETGFEHPHAKEGRLEAPLSYRCTICDHPYQDGSIEAIRQFGYPAPATTA